MSQIYQQARRQRRPERQWYEILWDAIKGALLQIFYAIVDGIVVKVKERAANVIGYGEPDWRQNYR